MLYRELNDAFAIWRGEPLDGVSYPLEIERLWTDVELQALGLYKPASADPVPDGKMVIAMTVQRVDGVVKYVHTLEDIPAAPDPAPVPTIYAAAQLRIQDGDITGIGVNSRFAAAFWGDVGKYFVFFAEAQPDTEYLAKAWDGLCRVYVLNEEKFEDFFIVTVTDQSGVPTDAASVNVEIVRMS